MNANWNSVSVQLHFDGSNGSTTFTDESNNGLTFTATGDAALTTSQQKAGTASLALDGSGDYIDTPINAAFGFGTSPFTIEAFIRPTALSTERELFEFRTVSEAGVFYISSTQRLAYYDGATVRGNTGTAVALNTWQHVAFCYDGTTLRAFLNGALVWSAAFTPDFGSSRRLRIGANASGGANFAGQIDEVRIHKGVALYTAAFTAPTEAFPDGYQGLLSDGGVLQAPEMVGAVTNRALLSTPGPLGAPEFLSSLVWSRMSEAGPLGAVQMLGGAIFSEIVVGSPLGAIDLLAWHDFTGQLGDTLTRYVLDVTTDEGVVRMPISSWQATLQTDVKCYVQCVVPACAPYVDIITAATSISIKRQAVLPDGTVFEYEMAAAPDPSATLSQGPRNYTATISGYADAFATEEDPAATYDRQLQQIRTMTTSPSNLRVRCAIDWLLRPGMRAIVSEEQSLIVAFINYYSNGGDEYMDVGDRSDA